MYSRPFWTSKVQLVIFLVPKSLGFYINFFLQKFFKIWRFFKQRLEATEIEESWNIHKIEEKTFSTCALIYLIYHFGNQIHHYLFGSQMIDFDNSFPLQTQKNASINNLSCTFFKFKIAHNDIGVPNTLFGSICSNQLGVLKESDNCK